MAPIRFAVALLNLSLFLSIAHCHDVHELIRVKWEDLGGASSPLGDATSDELPIEGGRYNRFQHGFIIWKSGTPEAYAVYGSIADKYYQLGTIAMGYPVSDELPGPNGGRYNVFEGGKYIYWKSDTGAHIVYGDIEQEYLRMGGPTSFLGYPISDEEPAGLAGCRVSHFEHGDIYWTQAHGAGLTCQG